MKKELLLLSLVSQKFILGKTSKKLTLEGRNLNITNYFAHIIKVFEDFRLVQDLREEIAKVKPCLIPAV